MNHSMCQPEEDVARGVLRDKRVLITRAHAQAGDLQRQLRALGAIPILFPSIRIVPPADNYVALDAALQQLTTFDWVAFTSVNGVQHVWQRLDVLGLEPGVFASVRLAAIGPATAKLLTDAGLDVAVVPERYVAEALLDAIPDPAGQRFVLPRATIARDALRTGLEDAGAEVVEVPAYDTVRVTPSAKALAALDAGIDVLTFTASSTVHNFVEQVGQAHAHRLAEQALVATIGPITAETARELGLRVDVVATEYTIAGLIDAMLTAYRTEP